jgi:hypothetical protein
MSTQTTNTTAKTTNNQSWKENLESNRVYKSELKTLSGIRKTALYLHADKDSKFKLDTFGASFLKATKKDVEKWQLLQSTCKASKTGTYSLHSVRIALRKIERNS